MSEAITVLENYLAKKIDQYKKDHDRLDISRASKSAILRLELEEKDIRAAVEALGALVADSERKNNVITSLQYEVAKRDKQLSEAQSNVDCILASYERASTNEDKFLTWIIKQRIKNGKFAK
jgi:hypothetical protein